MKNTFTLLALFISSLIFSQKLDYSITKKDSIYFSELPHLNYLPSLNKAPLPYAFDNLSSPHFRPIFAQTSMDCGQASSVGLCFAYEVNAARGVDGTLEDNQYPSFFAFNFVNGGDGWYGVSFMHTFEVLKYCGTPNVTTYGGMYNGDDTLWMSGYDKYYHAMHNRIYNAYQIYIETPSDIELLKNWINNHASGDVNGGLAVFYAQALGVSSLDILASGTEEAGKYVATEWGSANHAMTIVGYNDSIKWDYNGDGMYTNNIDINGDGIVNIRDWEIGAFKFANTYSGGPNYANNGTAYMMYKTLAENYGEGGVWNHSAYVMKVKENVEPLLTAKVSVTHNRRDDLKITVGYSTNLSATEPDYEIDFPIFNNQGGNKYMQGGTSDVNNKFMELGLDISRFHNYIPSGQDVKYFVSVYETDPSGDGIGSLNYFSVIDYSSGSPVETWASDTLLNLNNNSVTRMSLVKQVTVDLPEITTDTLPPATLYEDYSQTIEAQNGSSPYFWDIVHHYNTSVTPSAFPNITSNSVSFDSNSNSVIDLNFDFPFYGQKFNKAVINKDGYIMFTYEYYPWPYDHEGIFRFYKMKTIAPLLDMNTSAVAWYEQTDNYLLVHWEASGNDFACKIFNDGNIEFYYDDVSLPSVYKLGLSQGDTRNFQLLDASQIAGTSKVTFEYPTFPLGLDIDTRTGEFKGVLEEVYNNVDITFQALDNNFLLDNRTIHFYSDGVIMNQTFSSNHGEELHYGDTVQVNLQLINTFSNDLTSAEISINIPDPYFTILQGNYTVGDINTGDTANITNAFSFVVADTIPDNYDFEATLILNSNSDSWSKTIEDICHAPEIIVANTQFQDGGDNIFDPGETGDLLVYFQNIGSSEAINLTSTYSPTDAYLTLNSISGDTKGILAPNETWVVTLNITSNASTPEGHVSVIDSDIDGDKSFHSDNGINIGIGLIIENWETGTTDQFPWGFTGDANWFIDNTTVHEGNYALKSGNITHDQISTFRLIGTVATSGTISFFKKVSSENNYDFLRFYIDSIKVGEWAGEVEWSESTFNISSGLHSFEWKYEKDVNTNDGDDAAWVDYIVFPAIDFSSPEMQLSVSSIEKTMAPEEIDTDTIYVSNIGGGLLTYTATIDNASISPTPPEANSPQNKSLEGSTIVSAPNSINTGIPISLEFTVTNVSPDHEYIKDITISFPLGVQLDSTSNFVGGTGGEMQWDNNHGNGNDVNWHGENPDNGYGFIHGNGETATATLYLTIDPSITNSIVLQYQLDGDVYGADPHSITDFLVLTNNGPNETWLTLTEETGNLIADQNAAVLLNFNTFNIPEGTYNCNISVVSSTDSIGVPVTLHVIDGLNIKQITNGISIYPNPAKTFFTIENPENKESQLEIFDARGIIIYQTTLRSNPELIKTNDWAKGLYLIVIHQENKRYTQQLIVE